MIQTLFFFFAPLFFMVQLHALSCVELLQDNRITLLKQRQRARQASMVLRHGSSKVTYRAHIVSEGVVRLSRQSLGEEAFSSTEPPFLSMDVPGAMTIAPHPRWPGVFAVGLRDGQVEFISFDGNNPRISPEDMSVATVFIRNELHEEMKEWMSLRRFSSLRAQVEYDWLVQS